ncbi:MAG TPA: anti-sigma factor [Burkholderiales bacterium]|nr:anti-sigma factor [Burkholderiales bacterium]
MNCDEAQVLLHGYMDGELDVANALDFERHLNGCPPCQNAYQTQGRLRSAIKSEATYFSAPAQLRERIRSALPRPAPTKQAPQRSFWIWPSFAAALAASVLLTALLTLRLAEPADETRLAQDVIGGHVRSLMVDHLSDVASTDQHTVKPWFNGKLDFSPPVVDLSAQGFPLAGGRLDFLDGRPVAALVYRHRQHVINVFVWPAETSREAAARELSKQGYHVVHWQAAGMKFWAVSDLNATELAEFAKLLSARLH